VLASAGGSGRSATGGSRGSVTGVVDWDEFGLNTRAADLAALAFDCERLADDSAVARLVRRIAEIAREDGLRCLVAYRLLTHVAARRRRREPDGVAESVRTGQSLLDRLDAA
jgi:aminoglycoside phosphotransferase (APT) family kinase protein